MFTGVRSYRSHKRGVGTVPDPVDLKVVNESPPSQTADLGIG
jgi:hypothetical protein